MPVCGHAGGMEGAGQWMEGAGQWDQCYCQLLTTT